MLRRSFLKFGLAGLAAPNLILRSAQATGQTQPGNPVIHFANGAFQNIIVIAGFAWIFLFFCHLHSPPFGISIFSGNIPALWPEYYYLLLYHYLPASSTINH